MTTTATKPEQSATLPDHDTQNARNMEPEKELVERLVLVATAPDGTLVDVVDARWYMARRSDGASPVYCSVWIRSPLLARWLAGRGKAGGYGYCKQSAAFSEAVDSAEIKLSRRVDGVGMEAVREAMNAIAKAAGYTGAAIIV